MKILAVDTAEQSCSIALVEDNKPVCESFYSSRMTHSAILMNMIENMVEKQAGIKIDDVDGFAVSRGPGSFTGVRIGISAVKGMAFALSKPCAGISSLDGIGFQFAYSSIPVCVMMDAKRGEVYCAAYRFDNGRLLEKSEELVVTPENALLREGYKNEGHKNILFAGSGSAAFRKLIENSMGSRAEFAPLFQNSVKASILAHIVFQDIKKLSLSHNAITPVYLRRSDAETNYEQRHQHFY